MDAGNMLKPMLARGELHCIGATTLDEYRKYRWKRTRRSSGASSRWWSTPPSVEDTVIDPCAACKERFEVHHGVEDPRQRPRVGGDPVRTATSPTGSFRTRRSISSTRRAP